MTPSKDLKSLEEFANRHRPQGAPRLPLSEEAARQGLRTVEQLEETVALAGTCLKALKEVYEGFPYPQALIGAMGAELTDFRSHLPALHHEAEEAK